MKMPDKDYGMQFHEFLAYCSGTVKHSLACDQNMCVGRFQTTHMSACTSERSHADSHLHGAL